MYGPFQLLGAVFFGACSCTLAYRLITGGAHGRGYGAVLGILLVLTLFAFTFDEDR